jgi:hypothetical protein
MAAEEQGLDELVGTKWTGIDTTEVEVLLFETGTAVLDTVPDESCLRAEKDVENELDSIDLYNR